MQTLWKTTYSLDELETLAARIAGSLETAETFCLWLTGPLGAGKTTLTGVILRRLGLPPEVRVTSPTYTLMNDYCIGDTWYAHLDLYRTNSQLSPEDLGLVDARTWRGIFVEWPERFAAEPALTPTHWLAIRFADGGTTREYELSQA